jgi:hypothetical protein
MLKSCTTAAACDQRSERSRPPHRAGAAQIVAIHRVRRSARAASPSCEPPPIAIAKGAQFRPGQPISPESEEWATDYNELKDYGGQNSAKRTAQQTETARLWFVIVPAAYHPFARQLVTAKQICVVDSARFMALVAVHQLLREGT